MTKEQIRTRMKKRRRAVSSARRAAASAKICERLLVRADVRAALAAGGPIAVYLAGPDEIDLTDFITAALAAGARLVAPRWNGETYAMAELKGLSDADVVAGPHGILEPRVIDEVMLAQDAKAGSARVMRDRPTLWLVPGLAFTADGKRLGYGGGWYDRLLARSNVVPFLGIGYHFQVLDDLPAEAHDVRLDAVVDDGVSLDYEKSLGGTVIGVDEAGRGPLVGGVYAAAVTVPLDRAEELLTGAWSAINDSKQLTEKRRDELAEIIKATPGCVWAVASASAAEIDELNILRATHLAMRRAAAAVGERTASVRQQDAARHPQLATSHPQPATSHPQPATSHSQPATSHPQPATSHPQPATSHSQPATILVDGLAVPGLPFASKNLVKGDAKSLLVAAASILAKTSRDADCLRLERLYPGYGFAQHKGYPTADHLAALARLGPCPEHRRSFGPVKAFTTQPDTLF